MPVPKPPNRLYSLVASELARAGLRSGPKRRERCALQREQARSPQWRGVRTRTVREQT
jgi:hypothetical protein